MNPEPTGFDIDMLQRLYIDNYRSFVNFEFKPEALCLLVGENGGGKSTILEVIALLRDFVTGKVTVDAFSTAALTRWDARPLQRFEADFRIEGQMFSYRLVIEHEIQRGLRRVQQEFLELDGKPLYAFQDHVAQLYRDDHSQGPAIAFDWSRSGIGMLQSGPSNLYLSRFREHLGRILVLGLIPAMIAAESEWETLVLDRAGHDFVSWYRAMVLENPAATMKMVTALREMMPGLAALPLRESGSKRLLKVQFDGVAGAQTRYQEYGFDELSDGQRALMILYALLYLYEDRSLLLCLDEPDNYVALREIQPWLAELQERCATSGGIQAILVSHHPELMNYLGDERILLIERDQGGPTRVKPFASADGLDAGETLARGWQ